MNGVLIWALSIEQDQDFPLAMGLSCLAWILAIIYFDFVADAGTSHHAISQLMISGVAAWILLTSIGKVKLKRTSWCRCQILLVTVTNQSTTA